MRELRNVIERGVTLTRAGSEVEPAALGLPVLDAAGVTDQDCFQGSYHEAKARLLDAWERDYLVRLLAGTGGSIKEAADRAGLARAYVYRLIKWHSLRD